MAIEYKRLDFAIRIVAIINSNETTNFEINDINVLAYIQNKT